MGLQLIFVVETNSKSKSDWIYIKDTVERFYQYDQYHVKFTPVYMDGKGKYQGKKKEVNRLISQYSSTSKTNQSKVIYCFDCDDYDVKREDSEFLKEAEKYCNTNGYDFIWFCKDIECVKRLKDMISNVKLQILKQRNKLIRLTLKNYSIKFIKIIQVIF